LRYQPPTNCMPAATGACWCTRVQHCLHTCAAQRHVAAKHVCIIAWQQTLVSQLLKIQNHTWPNMHAKTHACQNAAAEHAFAGIRHSLFCPSFCPMHGSHFPSFPCVETTLGCRSTQQHSTVTYDIALLLHTNGCLASQHHTLPSQLNWLQINPQCTVMQKCVCTPRQGQKTSSILPRVSVHPTILHSPPSDPVPYKQQRSNTCAGHQVPSNSQRCIGDVATMLADWLAITSSPPMHQMHAWGVSAHRVATYYGNLAGA
jgi:hypothetical protein